MRRIVAVCKEAGLTIARRSNSTLPNKVHRLLGVFASPDNWRGKHPMLEVRAFMDLSGNIIGDVRILCVATPPDVEVSVWSQLVLKDAHIALDELPNALRVIIREREEATRLFEQGKRPPYKNLNWTWDFVADRLFEV